VPVKLIEIFGFLRFVLRRWRDDRCPQIAGSLTYTTLLALAPMFAIVVAVLSSAPYFDEIMAKVKIFLQLNLVPEVADRIITEYIPALAANAVRLTWVGLAAVAVVAIWLMLVMDRSINAIWRVRQTRPYWVSVIGYLVLLLSAPILIGVSTTITTYILTLSVEAQGVTPVLALLLRAVPIAMSTIAFFMIYRIVPHRRVPWRHALLGGFVAAILFEVGKQIFAVFVRESPTYSRVYGAFAAFPVFLVWLYVSWSIVLFGAELTASAAYWRRALWKQVASPGMRFREAAMIVRALIGNDAGTLSLEKLRQQTGLPADELEETLGQMVDGGVLKRARRRGYTLAEGTREILVAPRSEAAAAAGASSTTPAPATKRRRGRGRSGRSSR
jgi:membrane protein